MNKQAGRQGCDVDGLDNTQMRPEPCIWTTRTEADVDFAASDVLIVNWKEIVKLGERKGDTMFGSFQDQKQPMTIHLSAVPGTQTQDRPLCGTPWICKSR